jgi:hypothetical protein
MEIVIDKDIEMPLDTWKASLNALEIGHSFSFPRSKRSSLASIISTDFHALTLKRFKISVKNQPNGIARVWRIKDEVKIEETA